MFKNKTVNVFLNDKMIVILQEQKSFKQGFEVKSNFKYNVKF